MNKNIGIVIIVLVVLAGGGAALVASQHTDKKNSATNNMNMSTKKNSDSSGSSPSATNTVTIQNFAFSPSNITVKKGTTVTWTNQDSIAHTVTESDGSTGPNSGNLENGESYSFIYNQTGTFTYHCAIHPDMVGTVKVTD